MDNGEIDRSILDSVGEWTILKQEIVQYYAATYSTILDNYRKSHPKFYLQQYYIDGYASAGHNIDKKTGEILEGSALRVLHNAKPPFLKYFFVELDGKRFEALQKRCRENPSVTLYRGDANVVLPESVFPQVRFKLRERAFCLLDPYNEAQLSWQTVKAAADTQAIDLLVHFPMYSININVLDKTGNYSPEQKQRLSEYWGDDSWERIAYVKENSLFANWRAKDSNDAIVEAYRKRLVDVAGFAGASRPIPMKNRNSNVVYYLIFASSNKGAGVRAINSVANHFIRKVEGQAK